MFLGGVGTKCDKQVQMHRCEPRGVGLRARGVWGPIPQASKQERTKSLEILAKGAAWLQQYWVLQLRSSDDALAAWMLCDRNFQVLLRLPGFNSQVFATSYGLSRRDYDFKPWATETRLSRRFCIQAVHSTSTGRSREYRVSVFARCGRRSE